MPDYDVLAGSRQRRIELNRKSTSSFATKVDGKQHEVRLKTRDSPLGRTFEMEIDGKTYKIELDDAKQSGNVRVTVDGMPFETTVKITYREQATTTFEQSSSKPITTNKSVRSASRKASVEGAVVAPMTGKVVKIKVKKGEQVKADQVLCVVEAMKMENEICSPIAGTVQDVTISEGMPVNEGDTLFVIN